MICLTLPLAPMIPDHLAYRIIVVGRASPTFLGPNVKFLPSFVLQNFIRKRPSPYTGYRQTRRRLPAPANQGPSALGTNVKFLPSCFFETQMYRMENGTLRMGILKTKGLRPLVQNSFPFATKMPIRYAPFRFPKFEEFWNYKPNRRTDGQTN